MSEPLHRITIDHRAVAHLDRLPGMHAYCFQVASQARRMAQGFSPVRTGHYLRSLRVQPGTEPGAVAYLVSDDFKAWWIELGAYHRSHPYIARGPLRKAIQRLGLRFVPTSRRG